jgi:outer membrane protein OmpA-like peptidoglycan-associated protein
MTRAFVDSRPQFVRGTLPEGDGVAVLAGKDAAEHVDEWLAEPESSGLLLRLYADLTGGLVVPPTTRDLVEFIGPTLRRAFLIGEVVALIREAPRSHGVPSKPAPVPVVKPKSVAPKRISEKTFLDLVVVDEEGRPLASHRYKVQLPDARSFEGMLGSGARLFFSEIDPGTGRFTLLSGTDNAVSPDEIAAPEEPADESGCFTLRLVDEFNQPLSGVPVAFALEGADGAATTDDIGEATVPASGAESASAAVTELDTLDEVLRERWSSVDAGVPVVESEQVTVVEYRGTVEDVLLGPDQPHTLAIRQYVVLARLMGGFFDTSKAFLLPEGREGVRGLVELHAEDPSCKVLVVGHTDAAGSAEYNNQLSCERAESLKAYLTENVGAWLTWYGSGIPDAKRWGATEDVEMIEAMPDAASRSPVESPVRWYKRTRGLTPQNEKADRETRRRLIEEYMKLDGTTLPLGTEVVTHGCGESFPAEATADGVSSAANRRVEVFLFEAKTGVVPAPPGKVSKRGSKEYPEWVRRSRRTEVFDTEHKSPFRISFEVSSDLPWQANDRFVISDESGAVAFDQPVGAGIHLGSRRLFQFRNYEDGKRYRGEIRFGERRFVVFEDAEPSSFEADPDALAAISPESLSGEPQTAVA